MGRLENIHRLPYYRTEEFLTTLWWMRLLWGTYIMIERGGKSEERLYLWDDKFDCGNDLCVVKKTDMPELEQIIARHEARYYLVASFCRPGMKVLDFPCGSGYGSEVINEFDVEYEGRDNDAPTIEYAKLHYLGNFL